MSKIESFEETNTKFSIIPNSIFDILASSDLNPYETKILVIIARNTYGWRADFDEISVSQFMGTDENGQSTMSKPTVLKSLKSLEEKRLILSCLFLVNNVQKKLYFINTDESAKIVNLIKSGAIKYSELKSYRLHKIANQKSTFNLANYTERVVNVVDGGSQSPLPGGSTTLTGVVNVVDGGSQSPLPTKNNLKNNLNTDQTDQSDFEESVQEPRRISVPRNQRDFEEPLHPEPEPKELTPIQQMVSELVALGVEQITADALVINHKDAVRQQLDWLPHRNAQIPAKYIVKAIRENYAAPKALLEQQAETGRKEAAAAQADKQAKELKERDQKAKAEREDPEAQARARAAIEEIKRLKRGVA